MLLFQLGGTLMFKAAGWKVNPEPQGLQVRTQCHRVVARGIMQFSQTSFFSLIFFLFGVCCTCRSAVCVFSSKECEMLQTKQVVPLMWRKMRA